MLAFEPVWLQGIASFVPLTYGVHALQMALFYNSADLLARDVLVLALWRQPHWSPGRGPCAAGLPLETPARPSHPTQVDRRRDPRVTAARSGLEISSFLRVSGTERQSRRLFPWSFVLRLFLAPNVFPVYQFIAAYVGGKLGVQTTLNVGASFEQFEAGRADVGFICGLPYVQLARRASRPVELLAAPVLEGERTTGDRSTSPT